MSFPGLLGFYSGFTVSMGVTVALCILKGGNSVSLIAVMTVMSQALHLSLVGCALPDLRSFQVTGDSRPDGIVCGIWFRSFPQSADFSMYVRREGTMHITDGENDNK